MLVKVVDRILYKLDDLVRPYVHKILVVIEPLLIDEDYYARVEGREIISNLAKAAGLPAMIATMRPDIDHNDEFVPTPRREHLQSSLRRWAFPLLFHSSEPSAYRGGAGALDTPESKSFSKSPCWLVAPSCHT